MSRSRDQILTRLKASSAERDELIDTLRMWGEVKDQGIDPEEVDRFALREEFMNQTQRKASREYKYAWGGKPINGVLRPRYANCVIMKSGEVVKLNPWIELPYRM